MHVVHLVSSGRWGGTEASLIDMTASLRSAHPDWQLRVVAPHDGELASRLRAGGVPVDVAPFPPALQRLGEAGRTHTRAGRIGVAVDLLRALPSVATYCRQIRRRLSTEPHVDVVHAHGFKMQVVAAFARPRGARLVWHMHDFASSRFASARLLRWLAPACSTVIANSRSVAADTRAVCPRSSIVTVYNAIDVRRFVPEGPLLDLDALAGMPPAAPGTVRVGLVAAFGMWKGHLVFLRAIARLPRELPVRAYIVGGAQYASRTSQVAGAALRQAARDLGIADRVAFTGPVNDTPAAMRGLDVVVHASTAPEPFGMVIAEAMACGRAVIVARAGGAAELIEEGIDALAHDPANDEDLAAAIERLARDPDLRRRLGTAGRRSAVARFDRARLAAELAPIYTA